MTSREFLNVAHAALVEEFMRARTIRGTTVPGMPLDEALERAAFWGEGFTAELPLAGTAAETNGAATSEPPAKSEEEMVAQNEQAMQQLMARMSNVKGGFGLKAGA